MAHDLPPQCLAELAASADRYEAASRGCRAAGGAAREAIARGRMRSTGAAHPAALRFQVAREELWRASDDLAIKLGVAGLKAVRRGDVLYARVLAGPEEERERSLPEGRFASPLPLSARTEDELIRSLTGGHRIERIDLGAGSGDVARPVE
jgi:hypothetical protein